MPIPEGEVTPLPEGENPVIKKKRQQQANEPAPEIDGITPLPEGEQPIETTVQSDEAREVDVTDTGADEEGERAAQPEREREPAFAPPDELPILPLRGLVVYPHTTVPLTVGQPRSVKLVDEVVAGDRVIGLVASHDPELETPGPDQVHLIGTVAQIHRLFRAPDGTIRLLVQGMARIRVAEFTETQPYLRARVEAAPATVESGIEVEALMRNVVEQFSRMADLVPSRTMKLRVPTPRAALRRKPRKAGAGSTCGVGGAGRKVAGSTA